MVILVPLVDSGCSSEPQMISPDDGSKKPREAREQESRGAQDEVQSRGGQDEVQSRGGQDEVQSRGGQDEVQSRGGQGAQSTSRKRKAIGALIPAPLQKSGCFSDPRPSTSITGDQEVATAQDTSKKARRHSEISTLKKLQLREVGYAPSFRKEKFKGLKEAMLLDLYMLKHRDAFEQFEPQMRNRAAIAKIVPLQEILVLLTRTGVCCTVSRVTNDINAFVTRTGEITDDIFYNKRKNALIVSSSSRNDDYTAKTYRSIHIGLLRARDNTGCRIFGSEKIKSLIGFDAVNGIALLRDTKGHRIFDLETYSLMYKIQETDVVDIFCGPQALLVIKENRKHLLSLVIKQIKSGDDISYIYHPTEGKLECLEMFHEKVLIKERSTGLQIIDVKKLDKKEVPIGLFQYHPLYGRSSFLTFQKDSSQVRSYSGNVMKELDGVLCKSRTDEHMICTSSDDDIVIYLGESKASELGSVNICTLGREVSVTTFDPKVEVSCLSYNEDLNEIYVGTSGGRVYVYSV